MSEIGNVSNSNKNGDKDSDNTGKNRSRLKRNKNSNRVIVAIIVLLVLTIATLAFVNRETFIEKQQLNNDAIFTVLENGEEIASYNMEEIIALGEVDFNANLKTNGKDPIKHQYTGVLLRKILEAAGVDYTNKESAIVSAIDGYVVAVSIEKLMEDDNVYLSYKREGELLGTREAGGNGPYQLIISKDKFSQYWCKYAYSVELK